MDRAVRGQTVLSKGKMMAIYRKKAKLHPVIHKNLFINCIGIISCCFMSADDGVKLLMQRSERFLENVKHNFEIGFLDIAAFSLEQSIELFLKSKVLEKAGDFPHTQNIRTLMQTLFEQSSQRCSEIVKSHLDKHGIILVAIQDAYITSRYFAINIEKNDLDKMIQVVQEIIHDLRHVC